MIHVVMIKTALLTAVLCAVFICVDCAGERCTVAFCEGENCLATVCPGDNCTETVCAGENCIVREEHIDDISILTCSGEDCCEEDDDEEEKCTFPANWVGSWLVRQLNASSAEVLVFEESLEYNGVVLVDGENKTETMIRTSSERHCIEVAPFDAKILGKEFSSNTDYFSYVVSDKKPPDAEAKIRCARVKVKENLMLWQELADYRGDATAEACAKRLQYHRMVTQVFVRSDSREKTVGCGSLPEGVYQTIVFTGLAQYMCMGDDTSLTEVGPNHIMFDNCMESNRTYESPNQMRMFCVGSLRSIDFWSQSGVPALVLGYKKPEILRNNGTVLCHNGTDAPGYNVTDTLGYNGTDVLCHNETKNGTDEVVDNGDDVPSYYLLQYKVDKPAGKIYLSLQGHKKKNVVARITDSYDAFGSEPDYDPFSIAYELDGGPCLLETCNGVGTCRRLSDVEYVCDCERGFQGKDCELNVDFCTLENVDCKSGFCEVVSVKVEPRGYDCVCDPGYSGIPCELIRGTGDGSKVMILGPETVSVGDTLMLTCVADVAWMGDGGGEDDDEEEEEDMLFLWLRGDRVTRSQVLEKPSVTEDDAGWYTCLAGRDGVTHEASIKVSVVAKAAPASGQGDDKPLSTKEIIQYVFLTIAVILLLVACAFAWAIYFNRLKNKKAVAVDVVDVDSDFFA